MTFAVVLPLKMGNDAREVAIRRWLRDCGYGKDWLDYDKRIREAMAYR